MLWLGLLLAAAASPQRLVAAVSQRLPAAQGLIDSAGAVDLIADRAAPLQAAIGRPVEAAPPPEALTVLPLQTQAPDQRAVSSADPLRLWVLGDSLLNMAGPQLEKRLEATGRAQVTVDYRSSTGLVREDYFSWPAHLTQRLSAAPAPDAILVMIGANDSQHMLVDGARLERWGPAWQAEYARRIGALMDIALAAGSRVYWAGLPVMKHRRHQRTEAVLSALAAEQAALRTGATFLPTRARFVSADGGYGKWLIGADGRRFMARDPDGVHFTMAGAAVLADVLMAPIDADWGLTGPRREADGALTTPLPVTQRHEADRSLYIPQADGAELPALYLVSDGWGPQWPRRADATLAALAGRYGIVLIAAAETADLDAWFLAAPPDAALPVSRRGIAGLSTAAGRAGSLALQRPALFHTASWMSGVLDPIAPPWQPRRRALRDLTAPSLRVWRSDGAVWSEEVAPEGATDWASRLEQHIAWHTRGLL